jgi:hypothetical protein
MNTQGREGAEVRLDPGASAAVGPGNRQGNGSRSGGRHSVHKKQKTPEGAIILSGIPCWKVSLPHLIFG